MRTAAQLYTFRDLELSLPAIVELVARAGYDGVEFAFRVAEADRGRVAAALAETGLDVAGAHVTVETLEADPGAVVDRCRALDCDRVVTYTLDGETFASAASTHTFAERLQTAADRLADDGLDLCYHNHDIEFQTHDGRSAFDRLVSETDGIGWEVDAGWVAAAGHDPVAVIDAAGEVPLVHAKDMYVERSTPAEVGRGDVDLVSVASAARDAGTGWLVYEHDFADHPLTSMEHGADALGTLASEA